MTLEQVMTKLKSLGDARYKSNMSERFGITGKCAETSHGVSMSLLNELAKDLRPNHELAISLWKTGQYDARQLAPLIDDPELVTSAQMDQWCKDFDNWATCDTACFRLFDRCKGTHSKVAKWAKSKDEFQKRAGFALLACIALHDKIESDAYFLKGLDLIEKHSTDERNFVKKAVNWALRGIGKRNPALCKASIALSKKLATSENSTARWIGKDALRDLSR